MTRDLMSAIRESIDPRGEGDRSEEEMGFQDEIGTDFQDEIGIDDVSGESIPAELVAKARREEIDFMESWKVWESGLFPKPISELARLPLAGGGSITTKATHRIQT